MRPTRFGQLLVLCVIGLATSAQAHFKGPTTLRPDSAPRPDKMQPAPIKPLTPQGPLAAPATGTAKPLTPSPANAPAAVAPRPGAGTSPNVAGKKVGRSGIDTHIK